MHSCCSRKKCSPNGSLGGVPVQSTMKILEQAPPREQARDFSFETATNSSAPPSITGEGTCENIAHPSNKVLCAVMIFLSVCPCLINSMSLLWNGRVNVILCSWKEDQIQRAAKDVWGWPAQITEAWIFPNFAQKPGAFSGNKFFHLVCWMYPKVYCWLHHRCL